MPRSPLTPRQQEVRRLLVRHKGLISGAEIARKLNVGRTTVWRDINAIQEHRPLPENQYVEEKEITASLEWFDQMERQLMDELEANDRSIEAHQGEMSQVPFLHVRCNLLNQLRSLRTDRREFLLKIGYLREAPKRLSLETPLSEMSREELDREIHVLDERIRDLEGSDSGPGPGTEGNSAGGEAEALPLPPEADDHLQGA